MPCGCLVDPVSIRVDLVVMARRSHTEFMSIPGSFGLSSVSRARRRICIFGAMPDFSGVVVGQPIEYYSTSGKHWVLTTIHAVEENGFRVAAKKSKLLPFADPEGVRQVRARGTPDPVWAHLVDEALALGGGVSAILAKFSNAYSTPEARVALAGMLRDKFSAEGLEEGAKTSSFAKMPKPGKTQGELHPSMLSFDPASWDLFYVYESDFKREVLAIACDGLPQPSLQVLPVDGVVAAGQDLADFAWKPDGPYRVSVTIAAIMFMSITTVELTVQNPAWLIADLSKLAGIHLPQGSAVARGLSSLKSTILASRQNRMADPLMIDHMLQNLYAPTTLDALSVASSGPSSLSAGGSGSGGDASLLINAELFINRYNASVQYDSALVLENKAATRQRNLLDPAKCCPEMKALMRSTVEASSSFEDAGLSLEICATGEFWIGYVCVYSSHPQWVALGRTSKSSCMAALRSLFAAKAKGAGLTASAFRCKARRLAFAINVGQGIFGRRSVSRTICNTMFQRVEDGLYDDDIDNLLGDCDEEAPKYDDLAMDTYLADVSGFVQDALELQEAEKSTSPEEQARVEAATSMGEADWFMAEVEHDLSSFLKERSIRDKLVESFRAKEADWQKRVDDNVKEATADFATKHVPIFKYDTDAFAKRLQACREEIAKERACDIKKILTVLWLDLPGA